MKTINLSIILFFISLQFLFTSCNQDLDNLSDSQVSVKKDVLLNDTANFYKKRLYDMGFDTTSVYEWKDYYVIEDDILIYKDSINLNAPTTRQYRTNLYVSNAKKYTIGVDNTISTNTEWREVVEEVIGIYNANTGFRLIYTENDPNIKIVRANGINPTVCAQGTFPSVAGQPGGKIFINYDFQYNIDSFLNFNQKVFLLMHEVGHNLGLRHTDGIHEGDAGYGLIRIPGTPTSDSNSFMNSGTCSFAWNSFSNGDLIALNYLWPMRYFVTLEGGGEDITVIPNSNLDRSIFPSYSNHIFSGWYKDEQRSIPMSYNDKITSDITLYAKLRNKQRQTTYQVDSNSPTMSFTLNETTGVTLTAKVGRGLNEWWEISPYPFSTYAIVGRTSSTMKRLDMAQYIWHMNPETYIEHTEKVVLDAGTHWLYAAFAHELGSQIGPSTNHGITYAIVKY